MRALADGEEASSGGRQGARASAPRLGPGLVLFFTHSGTSAFSSGKWAALAGKLHELLCRVPEGAAGTAVQRCIYSVCVCVCVCARAFSSRGGRALLPAFAGLSPAVPEPRAARFTKENTGCPGKFKFQINIQNLGHTYTKKSFIIYLKFKFPWASCA